MTLLRLCVDAAFYSAARMSVFAFLRPIPRNHAFSFFNPSRVRPHSTCFSPINSSVLFVMREPDPLPCGFDFGGANDDALVPLQPCAQPSRNVFSHNDAHAQAQVLEAAIDRLVQEASGGQDCAGQESVGLVVSSHSLSRLIEEMLLLARDASHGGVCPDPSDGCLLYTSPSPRDQRGSRMPSSA